jgi:hypothetical protein
VDERERQRACRQRLREAGAAEAEKACHAPPSDAKELELLEKMLGTWDRAVAASRATLARKFLAMLRTSVPAAGTGEVGAGAPSRASLGG